MTADFYMVHVTLKENQQDGSAKNFECLGKQTSMQQKQVAHYVFISQCRQKASWGSQWTSCYGNLSVNKLVDYFNEAQENYDIYNHYG
jgi:hypothetical protein